MSNVLLISYLFPPGSGIGSPRALSYARYLPHHGCKVSVLTARFATTAYNDPALLNLIPPETKVHRVFNPEVPYRFRDRLWKKIAPARLAEDGAKTPSLPPGSKWMRLPKEALRQAIQRVACPDAQVGWAYFATRAAFRIVEEQQIDTILLNTPPYSSMKIAVALKRRFPHVKLISDIRDDWVGFYLPFFDSAATEYKRNLAVRLERELVRCSDFVSAVTPTQMRNIRERYPDQPAEKFLCMTNGYDPHAFKDFQPRPHGKEELVVTYFGSVYGNPVYSPNTYLDAVDSMIDPRVETRFVGRVAAEAAPLLAGRSSNIQQVGYVRHKEGLRYLEETDVLLVIGRDPTTHAGKLFDYLATGKPILALSPPDGAMGRILRETHSGYCVAAEDLPGIRNALTEIYNRRKRVTDRIELDRKAVEAYSWPSLVASLAQRTGMASVAPAETVR